MRASIITRKITKGFKKGGKGEKRKKRTNRVKKLKYVAYLSNIGAFFDSQRGQKEVRIEQISYQT